MGSGQEHTLEAGELAARLGGELRHCPPDHGISEVRTLEEAGPGSLSFLANPRYAAKAHESGAGLILVDTKTELGDRPVLVVANPYWAFAQANDAQPALVDSRHIAAVGAGQDLDGVAVRRLRQRVGDALE